MVHHRARRNVRQYTGQPIAREDLERILEAGRRAPSSGKWQSWNFVVVSDREQLIGLASEPLQHYGSARTRLPRWRDGKMIKRCSYKGDPTA